MNIRLATTVFDSSGKRMYKECLLTCNSSKLCKKTGLYTCDSSNYRPISNLSFVFKIVERVVAEQLIVYLVDNKLHPLMQSANRRNHFTETAMLRIFFEGLTAADHR